MVVERQWVSALKKRFEGVRVDGGGPWRITGAELVWGEYIWGHDGVKGDQQTTKGD